MTSLDDQRCTAAWKTSSVRQPGRPAAYGRLDDQQCTADWKTNIVRQPGRPAVYGSLEDQQCTAVWKTSIVRQPGRPAVYGSLDDQQCTAAWTTSSAPQPSCRESGCPFKCSTRRRTHCNVGARGHLLALSRAVWRAEHASRECSLEESHERHTLCVCVFDIQASVFRGPGFTYDRPCPWVLKDFVQC